MTSVFRKKGRKIFSVNIPLAEGGWIARSSETRDRATALRMGRMVEDLGAKETRAWDLLERVTKGEMSLPRLYDMWLAVRGDLTALRAQLDDVNIEPLVAAWQASLAGSIAHDTIEHYAFHVRTLIPAGQPYLRSAFTPRNIQSWLDRLQATLIRKRRPGKNRKGSKNKPRPVRAPRAASPGTKRKAAAAVGNFGGWLERMQVISESPTHRVKLPAAPPPRIHYLDVPDAERLADAQPGQYRGFSAFLAGTSADVSTALKKVRRRDFDTKNREVRLVGTKSYNRDRIVRVADWSWKYIEPLLANKLPDALIFDEIPNRWEARRQHVLAIAELSKVSAVFVGYTMKDARHTFGVRKTRAGVPPDIIGREMGHPDGSLVSKIYGRFSPSQEERAKWERIASAADAERAQEAGQ